MKSKSVKFNKFGALLGALLLLAFVPRGAVAQYDMTYDLDIVTNWPGINYVTARNALRTTAASGAKWGIASYDVVWPTNNHGYTVSSVPDGWWTVTFRTMTNYYVPCDTQVLVGTSHKFLTNWYVPYSNTLSVTIAGTNGMTAPVVWSFSSYGEFYNSSAYSNNLYTNNRSFTPVPTGRYEVVFPGVSGYSAPTVETNINHTSPVVNAITGTYTRVTNGVISIAVNLTNASWVITNYPSDFTDFHAAGELSGTGSTIISNVPVGNYSVQFLPVTYYTTPASASHMVNSGVTTPFEGNYYTSVGSLGIVITPAAVQTSAVWTIYSHPAAYTGATTGTGSTNIANVPVGTYYVSFGAVPGFTTPGNDWEYISAGASAQLFGAYTVPAGHLLTVSLSPPFTESQASLPGRGAGYVVIVTTSGTYTQSAAQATYTVPANTEVSLTAYPDQPGGVAIDSFVYKWYRSNTLNPPADQERFATNYTFSMTSLVRIWLLFSEEKFYYDNVGDIDQDGLPDEWEIAQFGDALYEGPAESIQSPYGGTDNPDGDFIPSMSAIPPSSVGLSANLWDYSGIGGEAGYPLSRFRMFTWGEAYYEVGSLGYAKGVRFNNFRECRGIDGFYRTNTTGIVYASPYGDDPLTDPLDNDTDNDGMWDGWEYYFWYWRSASSYAAGVTNSANLDWVHISPCDDREFVQTGGDYDTDLDGGLNIGTDLDEFQRGTDPTHCDTDGDGMDDTWEINMITPSSVSNALDYFNWNANPDGDFYATVSNVFVLTTGMVGTAFTDPVCYNGASNSPSGVWVDIYTNTGTNIFDLYHDTVIIASVALTNQQAGTNYTAPVLYGTNAAAGVFQQGYPVWVDVDGSGTYSAGDIAIINPPIKHDALYVMAPAAPGPGVCSFDPRTAWTNMVGSGTNAPEAAPNTAPYINYQEYLGGDYLGRISWDAGGRAIIQNDPVQPTHRNHYTMPSNQDSDSDTMPDGWELYVGLNPNSAADAGLDADGDELPNFEEWANATHPLGNCSATWPNKPWPTDPGVLVAPAPNDPHPMDTDWDGVSDNEEKGSLNPTSFDTDNDFLPDGWELYAGSDPMLADALEDPDGDGLENWREYLTGAVPEWMYLDARWNINLMCRSCMAWDPQTDSDANPFIPPDFLSCPSFVFVNGIDTNLATLRVSFPARGALGSAEYHSTKANQQDSDEDGMDDFWEVYHGLNPCKGYVSLMLPTTDGDNEIRHNIGWQQLQIAALDAGNNADAHDFQVGWPGDPFTSLAEYFSKIATTNLFARAVALNDMIGPFNCGLSRVDPDADNLPNFLEYSYSSNRPFYHTDPSPFWRTDRYDANSFAARNYRTIPPGGFGDNYLSWPFSMEGGEGFDTDHDGRGDYSELNSAMGETGTDPLDARNPIRNRALYLNGTNDFARTIAVWGILSESYLTRFCAEAWIKPDNPLRAGEQVVVERAVLRPSPFGADQLSANFKLGLTNGLPFIMYNGHGSLRVHQATAALRHQIQPGTNWTHIAGVYDGANLIIYVNGENSASIRTAEIPDNGINSVVGPTIWYYGASVIIGAEDANPEGDYDTTAPRNYFGGCIDEVRVWDGARTQAEIIANKDRTLNSISNLPLFVYVTFDNVPDPYHRNSAGVLDEPVAPNFLTALDTNMSLHPAIPWWRDCVNRSTIYTGLNGSYNYIVYAENHADHVARMPAYDDHVHYSTNVTTNAVGPLPADYKNTTNPYGAQNQDLIQMLTDFYLFRGARGVATNSWLSSLDPANPDATDSDGDGLPDWWEQLYGLDPYDATGDNGRWGDPDGDGLNNYAEYLAGTSPIVWDTHGTGFSDYYYHTGLYTRTLGEIYDDGDGMPDVWESEHGLDPQQYDAHLDLDGDGWSNYAEYQAGTDPNDATSYPRPTVSGLASYHGNQSGTLRIMAYLTDTMDGAPMVNQTATGPSFSLTGFKEGYVYLMAFRDVNGNGSFDTGEPMGIMDNQPTYLSGSSITNVRVLLTDKHPGLGRFSWTASSALTNAYPVTVNKISQSGAPTIIQRAVTSPRNYFHEWDFQREGIEGLMAGTYQWWMSSRNSTFPITYPSSLATPVLHSPIGNMFYYSCNEFAWTMDLSCPMAHIQIVREAGSLVVADTYVRAPWRDEKGVFRGQLGDYAGDWANGVYSWRVAGWTPQGESAWSSASTFNVNLSSTNSRWISGDIYYFGKAPTTKIILEAFDNKCFSGWPAARMTLTIPAGTNMISYTLRGLRQGAYYVRAFLDVTPAGSTASSGKLEFWSSVGFYRDPYNSYQPGLADLTARQFMDDARIIIRDKDTDNDELPDAWEMGYFGNLAQTGDMDYDGDGETNLEEYIKDGVNQNPANWDTDGDGLPDGFESSYNGLVFGFTASKDTVAATLNPNSWDTDGDGYSDGAELLRYRTDPLNPKSRPYYLPRCLDAWSSPGDYDGDGRSDPAVYDASAGVLSFVAWSGDGESRPFGFKGAMPLAGDMTGDNCAEFVFYDKGAWYIEMRNGASGTMKLGGATMLPALADYTGDMCMDLAVYDTASGMWYIYDIWSGAMASAQFGSAGMIPVPGDYNGDGAADLVLYHPVTGNWLFGLLHKYHRTFDMFSGTLGGPGWMPVPGDFDGDGRNDVCLYQESSGRWVLVTMAGQCFEGVFGGPGYIPVPGDYDGDGTTDFVVYNTKTGVWHIICGSGAYYTFVFGHPGAVPVLSGGF